MSENQKTRLLVATRGLQKKLLEGGTSENELRFFLDMTQNEIVLARNGLEATRHDGYPAGQARQRIIGFVSHARRNHGAATPLS